MLSLLERPDACTHHAPATAPPAPQPIAQASLFVSASGHRLAPHLALLGHALPQGPASGIQLHLAP